MTMVLDSVNSPLRIDAYVLPDCLGTIGMTICPGKRRPSSMSGDWNRDLDIDLQAVKNWGAGIVVTLLEDFEFREVTVERLGVAVVSLGMEWLHLPIPDKHAPGEAFARAWISAGPQIQTCLERGGKVLIHCMGGIGRTGTVAAQLLIERGLSADMAIAAIRTARQGAIETAVQENYLQKLFLSLKTQKTGESRQ